MKNISKEIVEKEWHLKKPMFGGKESTFHVMKSIERRSCDTDIYMRSENGSVSDEQVESLNRFLVEYQSTESLIKASFHKYFTRFEDKRSRELISLPIMLEVLDIPLRGRKYDLVLICSICYKKFGFINRSITLRVEMKNGEIQSTRRTSSDDSIKEN